ncbi:YbaK/EbsC family protein [Clostridium oryzae]|uniref:YbaK/aminoacyl-tRNA synthetase-associated domain-containing protein n=1 Tax=Clostridium oryzae TaxID=1450648 RepID=A0A1V4IUJ2_9CLOT|nr:hypothetical protein [Clostridium oryzae]OPJ63455.1 hypothetical protein CLORY_12420 [Clostridium oryzae]
MSISNVVNLFLKKGIECFIINPMEESNDSQICVTKPSVFRIGSNYITIIMEEKVRISYEKFIDKFKTTPRQLSRTEIHTELGFSRENINLAELIKSTEIYFDSSLKQKSHFYTSAGLKNLLIAVNPNDAITLTDGKWIDISYKL